MLLIIDNYDSFTYNLYQLLSTMEKEVVVVRNDRISVEEVEGMNPLGVILSPGPGRPEGAGICLELLDRASAHLPILGVCLGMQAMAIAYGGRVERAPQAVHGKASPVFHQGEGLFRGLTNPFQAGRYHSLVVTDPGVLAVDATTQEGIKMAVSHPTLCRYGIQFHPESILTPDGGQLLRNYVEVCRTISARSSQCA
jgi:anthranilate synthase component II